MVNELFKNIKYAWFYITEKCPLSCDYCFFRDRSPLRKDISLETVEKIVSQLPLVQGTEFIISGGEPFLRPDLIREIILLIRKKFKDNIIVVQTSGFLIRKNIIPFLKENEARVEVGIDGNFQTMKNHRLGIDEEKFSKIKENITLLQKNKVPICPTMTVHPQEAENLWSNFLYLEKLGLSDIDISPAFLGRWENSHLRDFKKNYSKIVRYILDGKKFYLLSYGYDKSLQREWKELNILPSGEILPSWMFMSLPVGLKKKYRLFSVGASEGKEEAQNVKFFDEEMRKFFSRYETSFPNRKELNAFFGKIVFEAVKKEYGLTNNNFKNYEEAYTLIGRINRVLAHFEKR